MKPAEVFEKIAKGIGLALYVVARLLFDAACTDGFTWDTPQEKRKFDALKEALKKEKL